MSLFLMAEHLQENDDNDQRNVEVIYARTVNEEGETEETDSEVMTQNEASENTETGKEESSANDPGDVVIGEQGTISTASQIIRDAEVGTPVDGIHLLAARPKRTPVLLVPGPETGNLTLAARIDGFLKAAEAAEANNNLDLAAEKVSLAYRHACTAKDMFEENGFPCTESSLAKWFGTCARILHRVGNVNMAIRSFYTAIVYDSDWERNVHTTVAIRLWTDFYIFCLTWELLEIRKLLKDLALLTELVEQKKRWIVCLTMSSDVFATYQHVSNIQYRGRFQPIQSCQNCLLRMARCSLKLNDHGSVRTLCGLYLQELCDYNSAEAFEIWAKSLQMSGKLSTALGKAKEALKYSKNDKDKERLSQFVEELQAEVQDNGGTVSDAPDEEWLKGTLAEYVVKNKIAPERKKKKHRRPKARERPVTGVSPCSSPCPKKALTSDEKMTDLPNMVNERSGPNKENLTIANIPAVRVEQNRLRSISMCSNTSVVTNESNTTEMSAEIFPSDFEDSDTDTSPSELSFTDSISDEFDDIEDDSDEVPDTDGGTFYEESVRFHSETYWDETDTQSAERRLLQSGVVLNDNYLKRFADRKPSVRSRPPFYETMMSVEQLNHLLLASPKTYKRCILHIEGSHLSYCSPVNASDNISNIEISGRSKAGQTFNEDEVVVELLDKDSPNEKQNHANGKGRNEADKRFGKVVGILRRHRHANSTNPVFVCTLDDMESHLVRPLCKTLPKIHILNKEIMDTCPKRRKYKVEVYQYDSKEEILEFKRIVNIDPTRREKYVFLVAYINWSRQHIYPRGAVIKILPCGVSIQSGLRILDLQCEVPTQYAEATVKQVENITIRQGQSEPNPAMRAGREDLTDLMVFTIDPSGSKDLDDALSVEKEGDLFKVGIHIADVASYIKKDDSIDQECRDRAMTFYPGVTRPRHMLPEPFSENLFSLLPGKCRLALTIFFYLDRKGCINGNVRPEFLKSVIRSKKQLTYREVQHIINETENGEDPIKARIKTLFKLAQQMRLRRLGRSMFAIQLDVDEDRDDQSLTETVEAHYLVEEFMVLANSTVGKMLLKRFPSSVPLRCQPPPAVEQVQAWLKDHGSIIDTVLCLQDRPVADFKRPKLEDVKFCNQNRKVMVRKEVLKYIDELTSKGLAFVKMDAVHPLQFLAYNEWISMQERAEYRCSGQLLDVRKEGKHFSLDMFPYTHFTSPIRRYIDVVVQRLFHAYLEGKGAQNSPYSSREVAEICLHANSVLRRSKLYQKSCKSLKTALQLKENPRSFGCYLEDVSEKGVGFITPELNHVSKSFRELQFSLLDVCFKPQVSDDHLTNRQKVDATWRKRLYDTRGASTNPAMRHSGLKKLYPHQNVVFLNITDWVNIVKFTINGDLDKLRHLLERVVEYSYSHGTVNDVSTEPYFEESENKILQPNTKFSMTFGYGQIIRIQLSAEPQKGIMTIKPQLFDLMPSMQCCLQHTEDPVRYLSVYASTSTLDRYQTCREYCRRWLPLVDMEAAVDAVRNEESCFINNVPVKFTDTGGKFTLLQDFCEKRNIQFGGIEHSHLEEDEVIERSSQQKSQDWLCIKCRLESQSGSSGSGLDSVPERQCIWVGHANITRVRKKSDGQNSSQKRVVVYFRMRSESPELVAEMRGKMTPSCSVELLVKSDVDRRTEMFLKGLESSTTLAQHIALNKRIPTLDDDHIRIAKETGDDVQIRFPEGTNGRPLPKNNLRQREAIMKAMLNRFTLIQGPPGTGKSYTGIKLLVLFSMINKKWYKEGNPKKQVMFCGPSNKSVDVVAKQMKHRLGEACPDILRVYGRSIEDTDYPIPGRAFLTGKSVRNSHADKVLFDVTLHQLIRANGKPYAEEIKAYDDKFKTPNYYPSAKEVKQYMSLLSKASVEEMKVHDIILCTTAVASNPKVLNGTNVFQIIIDEAGMCPEPNCLVPIIATEAEQVILIGDHKQLRPIILCKQAAELGLEKSLFERYATSKEAKSMQFTMLDTQYRMDPLLCEFPSRQFYDGKLKTELRKPGLLWQDPPFLKLWPSALGAPGVQIPKVFCHVEGEEAMLTVATDEGNEQSRSNEAEVKQVVKIFRYIMENEDVSNTKDQINVISQYNAQCHMLREALDKEGIQNYTVNTVVSSQGGEWDYVIFSTVRSLPEYKIEDNPTIGWCIQNLGFITDQNQINVALTRARKGIIIVGNRNLLKCDEVWRNLIENYEKAGCMKTPDEFPPPRRSRQERLQERQRRAHEKYLQQQQSSWEYQRC